jgi:hypothetical protein
LLPRFHNVVIAPFFFAVLATKLLVDGFLRADTCRKMDTGFREDLF